MHRVFQIDEVLRLIFENLLPYFCMAESFVLSPDAFLAPIPDKVASLTLLNAALTCRSFVGPALDALWWAMDDLRPLFCLLPSFRKEKIMKQEVSTISGSITEGDCKTFFEYATRIRFYNIKDPTSIRTSTYIQVSRASGRSCLLPSLNYLRCNVNTPQLLFLISPCLRAFCSHSTSLRKKPWDIHAFIDELDTVAPNLVCLSLKTVMTDPVLNAVGRMPRLKYLYLWGEDGQSFSIPNAFFGSFAARATIAYLHLAGNIDFDAWLSPSTSQCFPELYYLNIAGQKLPAVDQITGFLREKKFPSLGKFSCPFALTSTADTPKVDNFSDFLKNLGKATDFDLDHLDFGQYENSYKSKAGPTIIADLPILGQFQLLEFRISILDSISSADIAFIINSWPDLQRMDIGSLGPQKPRFGELVELAKGLPNLHVLKMELDCRHIPSVEDLPVLTHQMRCLKLRLYVDESHLDDPVIFSRCIDRLFPNLKVSSWNFKVLNIEHVKLSPWQRVSLILSQLQGARNDQAIRANVIPKSDVNSNVDMLVCCDDAS